MGLVKNKWSLYLLATFLLALIAPCIVFLFLYLCSYAANFTSEVYNYLINQIANPWGQVFYALILVVLSFAELVLYKFAACKGDVNLIAHVHKSEKFLRLICDLFIVFIATVFTSFIALPLGFEAPSVFMISILAYGLASIFKNKEKWIGECGGALGYGLAFLNPFVGFLYYIEAMGGLHKKRWGLAIYEALLLAVSYLLLVLLMFLVGSSNPWFFSLYQNLCFMDDVIGWIGVLIVSLLAPLFAYLFNLLCKKTHHLFAQRNYYGVVIAIVLATLVPLILREYGYGNLLGTGSSLFGLSLLTNDISFAFIAFIILFRFFFVIGGFNFFHLGGQAVPTLMLGALLGVLVIKFMNLLGVDFTENSALTIEICAALSFYAASTKFHLTSLGLTFSFGNPFYLLLPISISLGIGYVIGLVLPKESNEKGLHQSEKAYHDDETYLLLSTR